MQLTFISGNKGKIAEAQAILNNVVGHDIDLPEIQEIDPQIIIRHKLAEAQKHGLRNCFVEDTSLYIEALNGLPGPLIKWFLKTMGVAGLARLTLALSNGQAAEAKALIGYVSPTGKIAFFEGSIRGDIQQPRGTGFGWDPIFQPAGHTKTFGEMSAEEKNAISMRRLALEKLREHLDTNKP